MALERIEEPKPGVVAWLSSVMPMTPCEKGEAKYAKAIFDDGDTLWLRLDGNDEEPEQAGDDFNPSEPRDQGGQWTKEAMLGARHYRIHGEEVNGLLRHPETMTPEYYASLSSGFSHRDENGHLVRRSPESRAKLEAGFAKQDQDKMAKVKPLIDFLGKASLPKPMTVYRGMRGEKWREMLKGMKPGAVFQDNGLMSTSTQPDVASYFGGEGSGEFAGVHNIKAARGGGIVMEIHVPAGAHGASIKGKSSGYGYQDEYLFAPGRKLKLKSFDGRHKAVFEMLA